MEAYYDLIGNYSNNNPSIDYLKKVMQEIKEHGTIVPPSILKHNKKVKQGIGVLLKIPEEEELFLVNLWLENAARPNTEYIIVFYCLDWACFQICIK